MLYIDAGSTEASARSSAIYGCLAVGYPTVATHMDCLPSAAFSEEKLEATPSELQRAKEDDPAIVTVKDHQKHYRYLNRKPKLPHDIVDPHLPRSFPCRVFIRVKRILAAIENGTLPFMPLHPGATSTKGVPATEWP